MKYTDRTSKTVYTEVEIEVPDGDSYFHTWDEYDTPEYYYRLHIKKDPKFSTLYDIAVTKLLNYEDDFYISWKEYSETELPFSLRGYFCGEKTKEEITKEQFETVKQEVLNKLK